MRRLIRVFVSVILLLACTKASLGVEFAFEELEIRSLPEYIVRSWNVRDGLPFDDVLDLVQRKNGVIWVATRNGAARFDGVRFETVNTANTPELQSDAITALFEDASGTLWIGDENGQITLHTAGRFKKGPLLTNNPIRYFEEDPSNEVFAVDQTWNRIQLTGNQMGTRRKIKQEPPSRWKGAHENMWSILEKKLICKTATGKTKSYFIPPRYLPIKQLYETKNGIVFLNTSPQGILIISPENTRTRLTSVHDFDHEGNMCFLEDDQGSVWIGSANGLTQLRRQPFDLIESVVPVRPQVREQLAEIPFSLAWFANDPLSIAPHLQEGVWLGTAKSGVYHLNREKLRKLSSPITHPIYTLLNEAKNQVWINGDSKSIDRLSLSQTQTHPVPDNISILYQDSTGTRWAGGQAGLWKQEDNQWKNILPAAAGFSDIRCITEGANQSLWFGSATEGLGRRTQNGNLTFFREKDGLPNNSMRSLFFDSTTGTLWIGTYGDGLVARYDQQFFPITSTCNLSGNVVSCVLDDHLGRLWLHTNEGILVIEKEALMEHLAKGTPVAAMQIDKNENLSRLTENRITQSACKAADGSLYFLTPSAVARFIPSNIHQSLDPVPINIVRIKANDQEIDFSSPKETMLPPGIDLLQIEFSAPEFIAPGRLNFKHQLRGYDHDWARPHKERIIRYQHLPPGKYRLELLAQNRDGIWNATPRILNLNIRPFFWQTVWFRLFGVVTSGLVLLLLGLGISERIHRRKLIQLEQLRAVESERTRIARDIHDEIGAGLTRISLLAGIINQLLRKRGDHELEQAQELDRVTARLAKTLDEIVWVTAPHNDTLESLCSYLIQYISQFLAGTGIRSLFFIPPELPHLPLSGCIRHNLFLAVKEALNNIVKHAEATNVELHVAVENETLLLSLIDNGKGFNAPEEQTQRQGMRSMQNRMKQIGGTFELTQIPSGGVIVTLKLKKDAQVITNTDKQK